MDFARCAHDEQCKFFNNGGPVIPVRFYEAAPGAPTLGFTNVIYPGINDPQYWPDWTIGTPTTPRVNFTGATAPAGLLYTHICGTKEQFSQGAVYDPATPPIPIGANLLPLCCSPPFRVGGGAGAGGRGTYHVTPPSPITSWSIDVRNFYPIAAQTNLFTGGGGVKVYFIQCGPYLPATTPGWNFIGSVTDPVSGLVMARYWKVSNVATDTFPTDISGGGIFSAFFILMNGSGLLQGGVPSTGTGTSATPAAVNTVSTNTLVWGLWEFPSPGVPFTLPAGWSDFRVGNASVGANNTQQWIAVWQVATGLPFTPGAGHWTASQPWSVWSDSFF